MGWGVAREGGRTSLMPNIEGGLVANQQGHMMLGTPRDPVNDTAGRKYIVRIDVVEQTYLRYQRSRHQIMSS